MIFLENVLLKLFNEFDDLYQLFIIQNSFLQLLLLSLFFFILYFIYLIIYSIFMAIINIFFDTSLTGRQRKYNRLVKSALKKQKKVIHENYKSGKTDSKDFKEIYNKTK